MQQKNKNLIIGILFLLLLLSNSIWGVLYFNKAKDVLTKFEQPQKNIDALTLIERDTIYKQYDKNNFDYLFKKNIVDYEFDTARKPNDIKPIFNINKANPLPEIESSNQFTYIDTIEKEFEKYKNYYNFRRDAGTLEDDMVYAAGQKILNDIESKYQGVLMWGVENDKAIKEDSLYFYFDSLFERRKDLKEIKEETNLVTMTADEFEFLARLNKLDKKKFNEVDSIELRDIIETIKYELSPSTNQIYFYSKAATFFLSGKTYYDDIKEILKDFTSLINSLEKDKAIGYLYYAEFFRNIEPASAIAFAYEGVFEIEEKNYSEQNELNNKTLLRLYECINGAIENMGDHPLGMLTLEGFNSKMSSLYHRLHKHNEGIEYEDLYMFYRICNNYNSRVGIRNNLEKKYDKLKFLRNYLKTYKPNFGVTNGNNKDYNKFACMAYLYECDKNYNMALHFRYLAFSSALHDTTYKYSNYINSALISLRNCLRNCDKTEMADKYEKLLKKIKLFEATDISNKDHLLIDTIETKISQESFKSILRQLDSLQYSNRMQNWYYPKYKNNLLDRIYKNKSYIYDSFCNKFDSSQFYRANSLELNLDFLFKNDFKIITVNSAEIELDRMKAEKVNSELTVSKKKTDSLLTESRLQIELISNQKKRLENQQMTLKRFIYGLKIANEKKENAIVKEQSANSKLALQLKKDSILISQNKILSDSLTKNIINLNEANFEKDRTIKRNWWFALIIALLLVTLSLYIPWSSLKSKKQKLENQVVANMLNPHFMKNSVGGLLAIARINNYEKVIEPIDKVAMFLERYDKKSTNENITLNEELSNSKAYLETAKLAYETNFEIIGFDNSIELNFNIPSFLFLSVLENIIKHGFSNKKKDKNQIRIDIQENTKHTILKIINNGEKVIENARVGNGTTIVVSKIKLANLSKKIAYTKHHNNNNDEVETTFTFLK